MKSFLLICLFATIFSKVVYDLEQVRKDLLDRHNYYRAKHQAPNLERLAALDTIAQSYSEKLASLGYLVHSSNTLNGNYIGENLYFGYNAGYLGTKPVDAWYDEIKDYSFEKSEFTSGTGHFTQVIWKNTKQVGCKEVVTDAPVTDAPKVEVTDAPVQETSGDSEMEKFRKSILEKHNYYRQLHQVGNLVRDATLEAIAQKTADYMKETDNFSFATDKYNGKPIGQNLFWYWGSFTGERIADMWYESESKYDYRLEISLK